MTQTKPKPGDDPKRVDPIEPPADQVDPLNVNRPDARRDDDDTEVNRLDARRDDDDDTDDEFAGKLRNRADRLDRAALHSGRPDIEKGAALALRTFADLVESPEDDEDRENARVEREADEAQTAARRESERRDARGRD